jgi:hypothetical protein
MIYYSEFFERSRIPEVLMNNLVENVVANALVIALSAAIGLFLRAFGVSTPNAVWVALLVLVSLYVVMKSVYPRYMRRGLTLRLVKNALKDNSNNTKAVILKEEVVELVTRASHGSDPSQHYFIRVYRNQDECEPKIREAFRRANKVKILTIRGQQYFSGTKSLLHDICIDKKSEDCSIQVLVLAPDADHITEALALNLGHSSPERTRRKMRNALEDLKQLADVNRNLHVRCFDETPNFKMLLFDETMFVSTYIRPKNDRDTQMIRITREHLLLFTGLERDFDDLWKRSLAVDEALDRRV